MPKRTKEEIEEAKRKEKIRTLQKGPDLDKYLGNKTTEAGFIRRGCTNLFVELLHFREACKKGGCQYPHKEKCGY